MDLAELASFLDAGPAMLGASADEDLVPEAFRVWGATVDATGTLRALVSSHAGATLATTGPGSRIAFAFTDISDFRSVQVKGRVVAPPQPAGPADAEVLRVYQEQFAAHLAEIGYPPQLAERLRPLSVFAISIQVEELFDQTPGPGAGGLLRKV